MLIGISAPNSTKTREIIKTIAQQLNLAHTCMRQPVVNALAALLEIEPHELVRHTEPHRHFKRWGMNLAELEERLSLMVHQGNPLCFIDYAEQAMQNKTGRVKAQLYNGHLLSAIGTEHEAAWLRKNGGTLLHIYDYSDVVNHNYLDEHDCDYSIIVGNNTEQDLAQFIAALETKKEAA